jgi:hypothetical protein
MLEAAKHSDSCFLTLSYNDDHLPSNGSLAPADHTNFMKRFRKRVEPRRIRFYMAAEYGEETFRPHFHYAIFGWPHCHFGRSLYGDGYDDCCLFCDTVRDAWRKGFVLNGTLSMDSAKYISKYVLKGMNKADDPRLKGRLPEYSRMSNRPGIAAATMEDVALVLLQNGFSETDVPSFLYHGRKKWPLGRYLMRRLRKELERDEATPPQVLAEWQGEMFALRMAAKADEENPSAKAHLLAKTKGRRASVEARQRIFKQRSKI